MAKPALPFATLKRRLHRRMAAVGLKASSNAIPPSAQTQASARSSIDVPKFIWGIKAEIASLPSLQDAASHCLDVHDCHALTSSPGFRDTAHAWHNDSGISILQ